MTIRVNMGKTLLSSAITLRVLYSHTFVFVNMLEFGDNILFMSNDKKPL